MPSAEDITKTVNRYIELVGGGSAEDIAALYTEDAVLEDPVGGDVLRGRDAVRGFYANVENVERTCELVTLRVSGNEAAFQFRLTVAGAMLIEPIDVMVFDDEGKVKSMRAYWGPENVIQL
ncbi:MAG: nuclear transport factor 2 family protein [Mycobacteriaceae bacterium]|nr:nuclear transport factor 2 family protein [Mycobacteriaceae bacterium]